MSVLADRPAAVLPAGVTNWYRLRQVLLAITVGLREMMVGYWLVMVAAFGIIGLIIQLASGPVDHSVWDYGSQSPKYFSASVGITVTPMLFTLLVAQGVTRRMYSVAVGIYLAGTATATTVVWALAFQLEHVIFSSQGWSQTLSNEHLFTRPTQSGLVFVEFFLLIFSHEVAGWILGVTFYRFGAWKGILMLPIGLIPAAAAEYLVIPQIFADAIRQLGYRPPPLSVGGPALLVVSALGLYYGYRVLRPMGLKPAKG